MFVYSLNYKNRSYPLSEQFPSSLPTLTPFGQLLPISVHAYKSSRGEYRALSKPTPTEDQTFRKGSSAQVLVDKSYILRPTLGSQDFWSAPSRVFRVVGFTIDQV